MSYLANKIVLLILSFCFVLVTPVLAQQPTVNLPDFSVNDIPIFSPFELEEDRAAVILDGRELFQIGSFVNQNNYITAIQRAADINKKLKKAVNADKPPELEIKNLNGLPIIFLNDTYLFTVTSKEITDGEKTENKANYLKKIIRNSIITAQQERTKKYQYSNYVVAIIIMAIAVILNRILDLLKTHSLIETWKNLVPVLRAKSSPDTLELSFLSKVKLGLTKTLLWLTAAFWITDLFPLTRRLRYEILSSLWNALNSPLFSLGNQNYSIISILILLGLFWGLISLIKTITNLLRTRILNHTGMSRGSQEVVFIIVQYGLVFLGTIILLQIWGLNLSSLTILGSALGVGIGFGFQDIAKNFASGLVLLFERSVQVGDFIEVNGYKGTVERVGARSIVLRTLDRISIIVPNSSLLADEVVNWTHENSISRLHLPVGVAYGSDTEAVKSVLLEAATTQIEVLRHPAPQVLFDGFGDSSLNFKLLIWISEPSHQVFIKSDIYFQIEKLFREREIEIPFPHRDIEIRNPNLSIGLSGEVEKALMHWLKKSPDNQDISK
ncbi:MscS mechanosensitive ion channel family protein [Hyella patelloides LEGE 07179]|uniref:MscS mechanosensitive ion channel family protein n=1 Tax=Hyella patelloides LEGE 07179 TaxID=945734 RepID=A0A563VP89_9CYAN|nr:MscS mechanosensitive ion channel family protein [Hyella patelloides LEGE 07179]